MSRYTDVPELVERYMEDTGQDRCWVTVRELRARFSLDESAAPALAGFLQKIYQGPFFTCRYKVTRIEKFRDATPPYRVISRYCIEARPANRRVQRPAPDIR